MFPANLLKSNLVIMMNSLKMFIWVSTSGFSQQYTLSSGEIFLAFISFIYKYENLAIIWMSNRFGWPNKLIYPYNEHIMQTLKIMFWWI